MFCLYCEQRLLLYDLVLHIYIYDIFYVRSEWYIKSMGSLASELGSQHWRQCHPTSWRPRSVGPCVCRRYRSLRSWRANWHCSRSSGTSGCWPDTSSSRCRRHRPCCRRCRSPSCHSPSLPLFPHCHSVKRLWYNNRNITQNAQCLLIITI